MAEGGLRALLRAVHGGADAEVSDADLLGRFIDTGDQAAFELLVWRHRRMVHGVCRRLLRDAADAEDAFQATFLVLARKAASIARRGAVAGWLHRVARHTALRARAVAARRRRRERLGLDLDQAEAAPVPDADGPELRRALDEEVDRLPEKYRVPVVLCYLEGQTYDEAARQLDWPKGTVSTRLTRARELLRRRLVRRGLTLSAGAFATAAAPAPGATPNEHAIAALAEGVLQAMFLNQLKKVAALAAAVVLVAGLGVWALAAPATQESPRPPSARQKAKRQPPAPAAKPGPLQVILKAVDLDKRTATATVRGTSVKIRDIPLSADVRLVVNQIDRPLKDLPGLLAMGRPYTLEIADDGRTVRRIEARWFGFHGYLRGVDAGRNTLLYSDRPAGEDDKVVPLPLAKTAKVFVDGREKGPADLRAWMSVDLQFAVKEEARLGAFRVPDDVEGIYKIEAFSAKIEGTVRSVDAARKAITLAVRDTKLVAEFPAAKVFLNGAVGKLEELRPGTRVRGKADAKRGVIRSGDAPAAGRAERIDRLIRQLESPRFRERQEAADALEAIGEPALDALRRVARGADLESKRRAEQLIRLIDD